MLQIYSEMGCPHVFITLTTNTEWPELKDALPEGTSAFEEPQTVSRVFKHRLDALLHNLSNGKYFGGRNTEWITHVIEYQKRGLPHAHIVCRLQKMPENGALMEWIDTHITYARPPQPTAHSTADQVRLHDIVTKKRTVSYNAHILLDWDGHANVCYAAY